MSAFIVDQAHVDALIQAGLDASPYGPFRWRWQGEWRELTRLNASEVGAMLYAENVRSVDHRYSPAGREAIYGEGWETPGQDLPGRYVTARLPGFDVEISAPEYLQPYRFTRRPPRPAVEVLKAIDCFEYQSCETGDWEDSEAFAFCGALRRVLIHRLPGYDEAAWEITR